MSSTLPNQPSPPSSQFQAPPPGQHNRSTSDTSTLAGRPPDVRTKAFPFSFIRPFQPNPSSTSLVPSTAEGRPIPVDDSTVENRTSALRELNNNYPSRHRYERSTGAQSSTYSEPVIVRSYYSPTPTRHISTSRGGVVVHGGAGTVSQNRGSATAERRTLPFSTTVTTARNGMLSRMARARDRKRFGAGDPEETKLPPVEAFTFKSFMANMEAQDGGTDINADLDRIAEICARSRYSLSNQYEVHYAPHGSGSSFMDASRGQDTRGPTLQVVSADDERSMKRQRKRRNGARRNSRAMGTLETIMSSSRSSDEDKSNKKPAAELAEEVRGRAARKESGNTSPATSSWSVADDQHSQDEPSATKTPPRRHSASLALIDGSKQSLTPGDATTPRSSTTALVGEPALPQASTSHLEIRTAQPVQRTKEHHRPPSPERTFQAKTMDNPITKGVISSSDQRAAGLFSGLSDWMPWRSSNRSPGRAEGSLRELLRSTDAKGKGVEVQHENT